MSDDFARIIRLAREALNVLSKTKIKTRDMGTCSICGKSTTSGMDPVCYRCAEDRLTHFIEMVEGIGNIPDDPAPTPERGERNEALTEQDRSDLRFAAAQLTQYAEFISAIPGAAAVRKSADRLDKLSWRESSPLLRGAPVEVTDDMVDTALDAFLPPDSKARQFTDQGRELMRNALTAALTSRGAPNWQDDPKVKESRQALLERLHASDHFPVSEDDTIALDNLCNAVAAASRGSPEHEGPGT